MTVEMAVEQRTIIFSNLSLIGLDVLRKGLRFPLQQSLPGGCDACGEPLVQPASEVVREVSGEDVLGEPKDVAGEGDIWHLREQLIQKYINTAQLAGCTVPS